MAEAARIAATYWAAGTVWILGSDFWVHRSVDVANSGKGLGFVAVTAGALFGLVHDSVSRARRAESRLAALRGQDMVGTFLLVDGRLVDANARLAAILGAADPAQVVGRLFADFIAPEDRPRVLQEYAQTQPGQPERPSELHLLTPAGARRRVIAQGSAFVLDGGVAISGVALDATTSDGHAVDVLAYMGRIEQVLRGTLGIASRMVEARDPYTEGHQRRVGEIAAALAAELGLPAAQVEVVRMVGQVHDVGKIGVPSELLTRPSKLTPAEFDVVKQHTVLGHQILSAVDFPWPLAAGARHHHERWDGTGYPDHLAGEAIPLEARIVGVADALEAIAAHRPYRAALGADVALAEIARLRGTAFDPAVADACLRVYRDRKTPLPA